MHGEKHAEAILSAGLEAFGIEEDQLADMKKGADVKCMIAAIVREETAVKVARLAERLKMGSPAT